MLESKIRDLWKKVGHSVIIIATALAGLHLMISPGTVDLWVIRAIGLTWFLPVLSLCASLYLFHLKKKMDKYNNTKK